MSEEKKRGGSVSKNDADSINGWSAEEKSEDDNDKTPKDASVKKSAKKKNNSLTKKKEKDNDSGSEADGENNDNSVMNETAVDNSGNKSDDSIESIGNRNVKKKKTRKKLRGREKRGKQMKRTQSKSGKRKHEDESDEDKEDEEMEYEVEKILDVKYLRNNKRQFLIQWKGFSSEDDTWEPEENLDCVDLINEFFQTRNTGTDEGGSDKSPVKRSSSRGKGKSNPKSLRSSRGRSQANYTEESGSSESEAENNNEKEVKSVKGGRRSQSKAPRDKSSDEETEETSKRTSKRKHSQFRGRRKNKRRKQDEPEKKSVKHKEMKKDQNKENLDDSGSATNEGTEASEDGDKQYEVERILDVRYYEDGDRDFLIKWKGFSSKYNSWEPEEHLHCQAKLKKFLNEIEKSPMRELRLERKKTIRFTLNCHRAGRKLSSRLEKLPRKSYSEID